MVRESLKKRARKAIEGGISKAVERFTYPRLNAVKFGVAGGIVTGLVVLLTTLMALANYGVVWAVMILGIYGSLGYSITPLGSIVGGIYGFVDGFIVTFAFAWIYNKLL